MRESRGHFQPCAASNRDVVARALRLLCETVDRNKAHQAVAEYEELPQIEQLHKKIALLVLSERRSRSYPRLVKIKMSA